MRLLQGPRTRSSSYDTSTPVEFVDGTNWLYEQDEEDDDDESSLLLPPRQPTASRAAAARNDMTLADLIAACGRSFCLFVPFHTSSSNTCLVDAVCSPSAHARRTCIDRPHAHRQVVSHKQQTLDVS